MNPARLAHQPMCQPVRHKAFLLSHRSFLTPHYSTLHFLAFNSSFHSIFNLFHNLSSFLLTLSVLESMSPSFSLCQRPSSPPSPAAQRIDELVPWSYLNVKCSANVKCSTTNSHEATYSLIQESVLDKPKGNYQINLFVS